MTALKAAAAPFDSAHADCGRDERAHLRAEEKLAAARGIRNRIIEANLRLVVSVARQFVAPGQSLDELVSEGYLPLLRAVELFDVSRGYRFSTYATNALRHHYFRSSKRRAQRNRHIIATSGTLLDAATDERSPDVNPARFLERNRSVARELLADLPPRERTILSARFGLDGYARDHTFRQIAEILDLSKERVRVLANRALAQLRDEAERRGLELPECA